MNTKLLTIILLFFSISIYTQVGINTTTPDASSLLHLNSDTKGLLLPNFNISDLNSKLPVTAPVAAEGLLVYNSNTTVGKGIYYWDGTKWTGLGQVNFTNIYNSIIKPLNTVLNDADTYPFTPTPIPLVAPASPALKRFDCDYTAPGDYIIINNPLSGAPHNFVIWDNVNKKVNVPQQLLGQTISINISLKYPQITSNAGASRFVAFSGNAIVNTTTGTYSGGRKIKDLMFKQTKTAGFSTVRDELVLSPIVVTQEIIDYGIVLYLGSGENSHVDFYEPVLTIDLGIVNITL